MSFTLRQLQYFVAAAEHGSVSKAAQELSISQSAVTEALKHLEADLGVRLFDRHPRGLTTTQNGHQFLRHAADILAGVQGARQAFEARAALSGRLHLGVTSLMAGYVLSDLLAKYRRANPEVELTATEDSGEYLEHLLIGGELDVAVMVVTNLRDRMALQIEILDVSPYRLWLPIGHRLARQDSITLADVARESLILLTLDEIEGETARLCRRWASGRGSRSGPGRSRRSGAWSRPAPGWRCCRTWSTGPGRWRATGSKAATCRGRCRWCRSAWSGARARR